MSLHAFAASLGHRPLEILFGLYNPPSASRPVTVPRPLAPLGFFVSLRVTREDGRLVYASEEPKARLKLHPDRAASYREEAGARVMQHAELTVRIDLARGSAAATVWTCDFSYDYVKINADYRS